MAHGVAVSGPQGRHSSLQRPVRALKWYSWTPRPGWIRPGSRRHSSSWATWSRILRWSARTTGMPPRGPG
eukprot:3912218-Pyramimonas_sp.AAC.1